MPSPLLTNVPLPELIARPLAVSGSLSTSVALTKSCACVMSRGPLSSAIGANVYTGSHLTADFDAVAISVDGAAVRLTRREFELLKFLVENRNRVLSRDRLLERVWGYDRFIETRSVDVHVGRLRAKLGAAGQQIETVVGLGYRFVE